MARAIRRRRSRVELPSDHLEALGGEPARLGRRPMQVGLDQRVLVELVGLKQLVLAEVVGHPLLLVEVLESRKAAHRVTNG